MIAFVGFLMIAAIVALLLKGKMPPVVVLSIVPAAVALVLGYTPVEVAGFIKATPHNCVCESQPSFCPTSSV